MTARAIRLSVLVLILTASGCNKAPAPPPINASEYTLTWTETRDGSDPGFSARSTPPDLGMRELRQITINADNTFTMTLVDARSKKPASATEALKGTWTVGKYGLDLTTTENTLKGEAASWKPINAQRIMRVGDSGEVPRLFLGFDGEVPSAVMVPE